MSVQVEVAAEQPEQSDDRRPERRDAAPQGDRSSLLRFGGFIRPHRLPMLAGLTAQLLSVLTAIVIPVVTAHVIDGPIQRKDLGAAVLPVSALLGLGLLDAAGTWGRRWLVSRPVSELEIALRAALFRKLQTLSVGVHDSWESGQLLSRAVDDLSTLRRFAGFASLFLIINLIVLPVGLAVLMVLNWQIGLVQLLISIPLSVVCVRFFSKYSEASRRSQDQVGDLATIAEEAAQGIRVLKAFGRGPFITARFRAKSRQLQRTELHKVGLDASLWSIMQCLPHTAVIFALGYGGYAVAHHQMTLGTLVAGITLSTFLQWPIVWTGFLLAELTDARTAADRYWEIMDTPIDIVDPPHPVPLPTRITGEVRFERVQFRFPDADRDVLRDVSLVLHPGETVALVGATGSGKTALLNLIPRLYDLTSGRILIDGVDIAEMTLSDLRSIVAVAFEDPVLFSASVRENIALGNPDADDATVRQALEVAAAVDFVDNLPWGLDTRIGEQGLSLSGGQRQRLALARAVLSATPVVVLDDPLSALDVATEERVQAQLREVLADATTLLVAHRPSTASLADRVALLADGRIAAEGTHEHLLATNSRYRDLMGGVA